MRTAIILLALATSANANANARMEARAAESPAMRALLEASADAQRQSAETLRRLEELTEQNRQLPEIDLALPPAVSRRAPAPAWEDLSRTPPPGMVASDPLAHVTSAREAARAANASARANAGLPPGFRLARPEEQVPVPPHLQPQPRTPAPTPYSDGVVGLVVGGIVGALLMALAFYMRRRNFDMPMTIKAAIIGGIIGGGNAIYNSMKDSTFSFANSGIAASNIIRISVGTGLMALIFYGVARFWFSRRKKT